MKYKDHLGNEFNSILEMCVYWGVSESVVKRRCKAGYTAEQCLTGKGVIDSERQGWSSGGSVECTDHLGNCFSSIRLMCEYWGVSEGAFRSRCNAGHSLEEALTGKGIRKSRPKRDICTDHLGRKFSSIKEMCNHWGITPYMFNSRYAAGYSIEQCLTGEGIANSKANKYIDYLGNSFETLREMCDYWGVKSATFHSRYKAGWTLEQCLIGREDKGNKNGCKDHLGKYFSSVKQMLVHWGVSEKVFNYRSKAGYSLEQCLTGEGIEVVRPPKYTDHLGNQFITLREMCEYWGITTYLYYSRKRAGYTLDQCLTGKRIK